MRRRTMLRMLHDMKTYTLNNYEYYYSRTNRLWIVQSLYDGTIWFFNDKNDLIDWINYE